MAQDDRLLALDLAPDEDGYVFTSPYSPADPINPRLVSDTCKRAVSEARVPDASLHPFRHFAAVFALQVGESFKDVSVWMGHSDPGVTHRNYANYLTHEAAEEAAQNRDAVLGL